MSADQIRWEEPREVTTQKHINIRAAIEPLKSHPGRWARMFVFDKSGKAASCSQYIRQFGGYESTSRRLFEGDDQGKYAVFARFVGASK